jgi:hypothetical protein
VLFVCFACLHQSQVLFVCGIQFLAVLPVRKLQSGAGRSVCRLYNAILLYKIQGVSKMYFVVYFGGVINPGYITSKSRVEVG